MFVGGFLVATQAQQSTEKALLLGLLVGRASSVGCRDMKGWQPFGPSRSTLVGYILAGNFGWLMNWGSRLGVASFAWATHTRRASSLPELIQLAQLTRNQRVRP